MASRGEAAPQIRLQGAGTYSELLSTDAGFRELREHLNKRVGRDHLDRDVCGPAPGSQRGAVLRVDRAVGAVFEGGAGALRGLVAQQIAAGDEQIG